MLFPKNMKFLFMNIFENNYVRNLAIQDHIREIQLLYDQYKIEKNKENFQYSNIISNHIRNELADLFLILEKELDDEVLERRKEKFLSKE